MADKDKLREQLRGIAKEDGQITLDDLADHLAVHYDEKPTIDPQDDLTELLVGALALGAPFLAPRMLPALARALAAELLAQRGRVKEAFARYSNDDPKP